MFYQPTISQEVDDNVVEGFVEEEEYFRFVMFLPFGIKNENKKKKDSFLLKMSSSSHTQRARGFYK